MSSEFIDPYNIKRSPGPATTKINRYYSLGAVFENYYPQELNRQVQQEPFLSEFLRFAGSLKSKIQEMKFPEFLDVQYKTKSQTLAAGIFCLELSGIGLFNVLTTDPGGNQVLEAARAGAVILDGAIGLAGVYFTTAFMQKVKGSECRNLHMRK